MLETINDYIPVIATISGATIGIGGGVLLHRTNSSLASLSEKRRLIREKLEDAHQSILLLDMWALERLALKDTSEEPAQVKGRLSRIVFLCSCYSDNCTRNAELMSNQYTGLLKLFSEYESIDKDDCSSVETILEKIMVAYEECKSTTRKLKSSIAKEVRNNV